MFRDGRFTRWVVLVWGLWACGGSGGADVAAPDDAVEIAVDAVPGEVVDVLADAPAVDVPAEVAPDPWPMPHACLVDPACRRPLVAAHRGYIKHAPENSLASLRAAAALGVDFVEIDTDQTRDGVLVLMHDGTVDRTTDGTGNLRDLSWAEVQALTLNGADPADPETQHVPRFSDELALAKQLGVMLYVDQGTDLLQQVVDEIAAGPYFETALVRDPIDTVAAQKAMDPRLLVMPPVESAAEIAAARAAIPDLLIVEIGKPLFDADLTAAVLGAGLKVQQDVFLGDIKGVSGDYTGWKQFVDAGVTLLQTQIANLLVPAVQVYLDTGEFPSSGPADPDASTNP